MGPSGRSVEEVSGATAWEGGIERLSLQRERMGKNGPGDGIWCGKTQASTPKSVVSARRGSGRRKDFRSGTTGGLLNLASDVTCSDGFGGAGREGSAGILTRHTHVLLDAQKARHFHSMPSVVS